ncbi:hypothetical protein R3P38DRAFT_2503557 [Favolaschia claudopus]|uniref:Ricin B lectin domain-containing protein n=1 Tax=Favolaschia claudopus TaxID=2862362 RepID=A0AAW0DHE5_9AGAR
MLFSFALLTALTSVASAAPASKRQDTCSLQNLKGLTVTASADNSGKTRWDLFTTSSGLIQQGDLAWLSHGQPNGNEVFTAEVGSQPNLFTFHRQNAQAIGVSGSKLLASDTAAVFKVSCNTCNDFASGNQIAANECTFELTDGANGTGECITFEANRSVVQLQDCESGNAGQQMGIFSA